MPKFQDIVCPQSDDLTHLSRVLGTLKYSHDITARLTGRQEGEYCIAPVDLAIFDEWCRRHKDYPHSLQYSDKQLVICIMYPDHDRSAGIIITYIKEEANDMCGGGRAVRDMLSSGTGCPHHISNNAHD